MWMQRERPSIPHHGRDSSARINGHSRYGIFGPRTELELGTELVLNEDLKKPTGEHDYDSDAPPIARQIRCALVRNRHRHTEAARQGSADPHRTLRTVPFRPAHPGWLRRPRRRQEARYDARHDATVHAGT